MLRKALKRIVTSTKPQGKPSLTMSKELSSEKPKRKETLDERADRVTKMMIENLKNPANHPTYQAPTPAKDK